MGWIGCVHCEKFQNDFMAQTCALIAPLQPVLHRVSCSNETLPNATKHYETYQNMSLGSNGVDRFHSLRKIPMRLRGTNFCISCTCSARFVSSIVQYQNNPKCIQTLRDTPKHEFRAQWGGSGAFVAKNSDATSWARTFALIAPVQPVLHQASCINETIQNAPKHYEMQQHMSLGSNEVGRVHSLRKIPKRLHGTNLCINCTSSSRFAPSFM